MNSSPRKIFISVGEESADLHTSDLCQHLKTLDPSIELFGFGGKKMEQAGVEILYPLPELAIIGFWEVLKHLPKIYHIRSIAFRSWEERKPDAILLVDYPGFHLRLAEAAHQRGIPVYYFIAPQAWAWKENRVTLMQKVLNHLFVIFPFEEPFFAKRGIPTTYVGHPLVQRIKNQNISTHNETAKTTIGLLPGSRKNEIAYLLPTMIDAATNLREKKPDYHFLFPLADTIEEKFLQKFSIPRWIEICRDKNYQRRKEITFAWTASGTATVEYALLGIPMAVVYKTNFINITLGRRLIRTPYIGMVNLIAQKGICPEFIQEQFQASVIVRYTAEILSSPQRYQEMKEDLKKVRQKIGDAHASQQTAEFLIQHWDSN